MAQPFSFPPPPPPPPKPVHNSLNPSNDFRGGQRGRGSLHRTQQNGREYGHLAGQRNSRGNFGSQRNGTNYRMNDHSQRSLPLSNSVSSYQSPDSSQTKASHQGQKRNHATAFHNRTHTSLRNSRPTAPPAVPSFGLDLDNVLSKKAEAQASSAIPLQKKANILGLTPASQDSGSEDDEGEEAKLADGGNGDHLLRFEYRGNTSTLSTPEDIAAWISERRRKWPTEAKRETARKELEERKKQIEEDKAKRLEANRAAAKARHEEWQRQKLEKEKSQLRQRMLKEQILKANAKPRGDAPQSAAQLKAEKLKRKAEKIARQLEVAEAALHMPNASEATDDAVEGKDLDILLAQVERAAKAQDYQNINRLDNDAELSDSSTSSSDIPTKTPKDDTSTSGSSDESDSDSAPEQFTSKRAGPERISPPAHKAANGTPQQTSSNDQRPICTNFAKTGRCKFGRRCHYRHPKPEPKGAQQPSVGNRRKGLYQVMVEKEQEEERMKTLRAIVALGDQGLLDDDNEKQNELDEKIS